MDDTVLEQSDSLQSPATTVRRLAARARYDRDTIHAILDEALICHVGFVQDGQPYVIPTNFGRAGETLYLHGSAASRMLRTLSGATPTRCKTGSTAVPSWPSMPAKR